MTDTFKKQSPPEPPATLGAPYPIPPNRTHPHWFGPGAYRRVVEWLKELDEQGHCPES